MPDYEIKVTGMMCGGCTGSVNSVVGKVDGVEKVDAKHTPDDKVLVPGVVDTTTNFVEHPELVAQRIARFVDIVGTDRVIAGSDCGFGTFAGFGAVDPDIAYAKLATLAEGAALASGRL